MSITLNLPPQIKNLLRQRTETIGQDMGKLRLPFSLETLASTTKPPLKPFETHKTVLYA
jgi:hypothetical protein